MRKINAAGLALVQEFEGLRLVAYDDLEPDRRLQAGDKLKGTLTIGHGHTGPGVFIGQTITKDQATRLLSLDLAEAERGVEGHVTVPLNDNEFAALASLTFNIGTGNLQRSTLLRKLNAGDRLGAAAEFARWNMAGGKVLAGLTRRRAAEAALFIEPTIAATAAMPPTQSPDGVEAKPKKRSLTDIALGAVPMVGAAFAGWDWRALVAIALVAGGIAFWLIRRGQA